MAARLDGKTAFVAGSGAGIGAAIARRFAAEGARVMCADLDPDSAARIAGEITAAGGTALAARCDVSASAEVRAALDRAEAAFGRIDVLVGTAATDDPLGTTVEISEADWNRTLAVNLTGAFLLCKHGIPKLAAAGGGSIVIIASQLGQVVTPRRPAYVTTKAALIQLARSLAVDHAKDGIRVNTLSPGAVETDRLLRRYGTIEKVRAALAPLHPLGRLARPEEIAAGALFLASAESSFMTGADLVIDGGYTCL